MTEFNITNNTAGTLVLASLDNFSLGAGQTKDMFAQANGNFAVSDMVQNEKLQASCNISKHVFFLHNSLSLSLILLAFHPSLPHSLDPSLHLNLFSAHSSVGRQGLQHRSNKAGSRHCEAWRAFTQTQRLSTLI